VRVADVMSEAQAARAERRAQESVVLLASARREADEAAQKVTLLKGGLVVV
jgi:hypothetical protein